MGLYEPCFFHSVKEICSVFTFERRGEKFIKLNLFPTVISHTSLRYRHQQSPSNSVFMDFRKPRMRLCYKKLLLFLVSPQNLSLQLPEPAAYLESQFNSVTSNIPHPSAFDPGSLHSINWQVFKKTEAKQKKIVQFPNDTDVASLE